MSTLPCALMPIPTCMSRMVVLCTVTCPELATIPSWKPPPVVSSNKDCSICTSERSSAASVGNLTALEDFNPKDRGTVDGQIAQPDVGAVLSNPDASECRRC